MCSKETANMVGYQYIMNDDRQRKITGNQNKNKEKEWRSKTVSYTHLVNNNSMKNPKSVFY